MKKIAFLLVAVVAVFAAAGIWMTFNAFDVSAVTKRGASEKIDTSVVRRDFKIGDFTGVDVAGDMDVTYTRGKSASMTVSGPKVALDNMEVSVKNGRLSIGFSRAYYDMMNNRSFSWKELFGKDKDKGKIRVTLSSKSAVAEVGVSLSADFSAMSLVTDGPLSLSASTSGDIKVNSISCNRLDARAHTSGDIKATTVKASSAGLDAQTSGDIKFDSFTVDNLKASAQTSGDVKIGLLTATKVTASASTSGDVVLAGSATEVEFNASTSGDIKAGDLSAEVATVSASTSGDIKYCARKTLNSPRGVRNVYHED